MHMESINPDNTESEEVKKDEKSKAEEKEKRDKQDKVAESTADDGVFNLKEDAHLQEAIRITGDYIQLLKGRNPGKMAFPALAEKDKKKKKKK